LNNSYFFNRNVKLDNQKPKTPNIEDEYKEFFI